MDEQGNDDYYIYRGGNERFEGVCTVEVDTSVTYIEDYAFSHWGNLRCIRIPNGITAVSQGAFYECKSLTSVTLPPSVTSIGGYAFCGCTSLTSVTLPPSLTTIGGCAFQGCTSLISVTLPPSMTSIDSCAFEDCTSLTSATLPSSIISIDSDVFKGCMSLVSVTLASAITTIGTEYTFPTTTMDKSPGWFQNFLVEAGFSRENPNDILGGLSLLEKDYDEDSYEDPEEYFEYYEWNTWARTIGEDGRLPLFTAANESLKWYYTKQIFAANMPAINKIDVLSGLPLFLLAAAGPTSDIESVYNLLKEFPGAFSFNES